MAHPFLCARHHYTLYNLDMSTQTKKCKTCNKELPFEAFYNYATGTLHPKCKKCYGEHIKKRRQQVTRTFQCRHCGKVFTKTLAEAPSFRVFCSRECSYKGKKTFIKTFYTFEEAKEAVQDLGIRSQAEYFRYYKIDPKLPSSPTRYKEFVDWYDFLGKDRGENKFYTYEEAQKRAQELGFTSKSDYNKNYKIDPRLPGDLRRYKGEFKSWYDFLGKKTPSQKRLEGTGSVQHSALSHDHPLPEADQFPTS